MLSLDRAFVASSLCRNPKETNTNHVHPHQATIASRGGKLALRPRPRFIDIMQNREVNGIAKRRRVPDGTSICINVMGMLDRRINLDRA